VCMGRGRVVGAGRGTNALCAHVRVEPSTKLEHRVRGGGVCCPAPIPGPCCLLPLYVQCFHLRCWLFFVRWQMFTPLRLCPIWFEGATFADLFKPRRKLRPRSVASAGATSVMPHGLVVDDKFEILVQVRGERGGGDHVSVHARASVGRGQLREGARAAARTCACACV
jgi:hypothetical protein